MRVNPFSELAGIAGQDARLNRTQGKNPAQATEAARLEKAAAEFEALLTEQLVSTMRKTVPESVFFNSPGVKLFNEMLDGEYVRIITDRGGIGLRDFLRDGFVKAQGLPLRQE